MTHSNAMIRKANRREFLRSAVALTAATLVRPTVGSGAPISRVRIEEPFCGAILDQHHGKHGDGGLAIRVAGSAPASLQVAVNGAPAWREGDHFISEVVLRQKVNEIVARVPATGEEDRVRVVWDRFSRPRYNFAVDDNIFFLRDIARKPGASLFDCSYLKLLRKLHKQYGARFTLNLYFTSEDGFKLTDFPDRYREEWKDNAGWLKLSFHAYADKPDRPYQASPPAKLLADYDLVAEQIRRFAGSDTFVPPTNLHWSMARADALTALAKRGVRVLSGYFRPSNGRWDINYDLDDRRSEFISKHDRLMDFELGIIFIRDAIVCNATPVDQVAAVLDPLDRTPNHKETINLLTHEQYFWPSYPGYVPDHPQRVEAAIRWATDHGYRPSFFHEGLLGGAD
jgi:hypothetical protein